MTDRYRIVQAAFDPALMGPLEPDENALRVQARLSDDEYRYLAGLLASRPDAWLWLDNRSVDLEALEHFPGLRNLMVTSLRLETWAGIRHVAGSIEQLQMGDTTLKPVSIEPLGELSRITSLSLIGPVRNAEAIATLTGIVDLGLRSVTLDTLRCLLPMRQLKSLRLLLGGTTDLNLLPEILSLEELELWRIRGLRDLSVLGSLTGLRALALQSMSAITALPSFERLTGLRRVALDTMKGITDLRPIAAAPNLEELLLVAMPQLSPEDLTPLVGHPTLRRGIWGLGSKKKNAAAYDLLPLEQRP